MNEQHFPAGNGSFPYKAVSADSRWVDAPLPRIPGFAAVEWNIQSGHVWYSPEWRAITLSDYDPDKPNDKEWWEQRVSPADLANIYRACMAVHTGLKEEAYVVFRLKRGDGVWRTILSKSRVTHRTADGVPAIASGFMMDITELSGEELVLRQVRPPSEMDYQSMLENSPDLFIRFNKDLDPVYVNPAINRYLGGLNNEPGHDLRLTGDYKAVFQKNVARVFAEKTVVRDELALRMTDGSTVIGDASFWPEFNDQNEVQYAMVQCRDITAQRNMAERLSLNEQRIQALYRLTVMEEASEAEVLRYVMDSMLRIFKSSSGFIFLPSAENEDKGLMLWSDEHYAHVDRRYLPDDHMPPDLIIQMTGKDGRRVYRGLNNSLGDEPLYVVFGGTMRIMRGLIAPVVEGGRTVCIGGVCNKDSDYEEADLRQLETFLSSAWLIIRRRRFVRELQEAKDTAETANKAKNAFLANVSHELRTPLNGVLSMLQLMETMPLGSEQRAFLQTAQTSGKALLRIISDLLDYSSMEAGKMRLNLESFDCKSIVRGALEMFAGQAARKGLDFTYSIDPALPARLLGDESRLRQIIYNIVGNALKFTEQGGVRVCCAALPTDEANRTGLVLEVADTGIGIPKDKLENIFEAFTQVETTHRRQYSGTGLGLSIVKHLVNMMGGAAYAESEPGRGTVVHCELFFDQTGPECRGPRQDLPARVEVLRQRKLDILVAEDDKVGRMALRAFLQRRGHRVFLTEDGREALEALQLHAFDCVFTDISMPNMDGLELLQRIRSRNVRDYEPSEHMRRKVKDAFGEEESPPRRPVNPAVAVIAVSAHAMIGDKDRFLELGMDYYVSKPIDKNELDMALEYVIRRKECALEEYR